MLTSALLNAPIGVAFDASGNLVMTNNNNNNNTLVNVSPNSMSNAVFGVMYTANPANLIGVSTNGTLNAGFGSDGVVSNADVPTPPARKPGKA